MYKPAPAPAVMLRSSVRFTAPAPTMGRRIAASAVVVAVALVGGLVASIATSSPRVIPGLFSLQTTDRAGNVYVHDFNLTLTDCVTTARWQAGGVACATQR